MSDPTPNPEVAVIIPLEDPRGDVAEHLRTWTRSQTIDRERFQVVLIADGAHPDFEREVEADLAAWDELVSAPGASLMGLYDAGARAARAPVLLLSEAHVRADPRCVDVVANAFSSDAALDAATLRHIQSSSEGISPLSERWFARTFDEWSRAGWMRLNTTAVAIRAEAFDRAGRLDPRLGLFAPSLLSARLDLHGSRITHLDEAVVTHELEEEMGYALELGGDFVRGECIVRQEQDPEFCERYFGSAGLLERRLAYRPEPARAMVSALMTAIRESPREAGWISRELLVRLPARVAGARPRLAWERTTTAIHRAVAATAALPDEPRWRSYVAAQEANVRAVQLTQLAARNGSPAPTRPGDGPIGAARLHGILIGLHAVESEQSRAFRWTEPVTLARVEVPAGGAVLRIETAGLRGPPSGFLQGVYCDGKRLPAELIGGDEETLEIRIPGELARPTASSLVLVCRPLLPSRNGSDDHRRLGIPIAGLELSPA